MVGEHLRVTGSALRRWLVAQAYDAAAVGVLWLAGLLILEVPLAPLWAVLGAALQFLPGIGTLVAMVGPATAAALAGGWRLLFYVMVLYAVIVTVDGLLLQPLIMKGTARIPLWASVCVPLALGLVLNIWGVALAIPLLAVVYGYREHDRRRERHRAGAAGE